MAAKKRNYIIGIDEVGRGPLAGCVTVAAVIIPKGLKLNYKDLKIPLRDSKKLTPKRRDLWFKYIQKHPEIFYAIKSISPAIIDKVNISKAANLAATRAITKLLATSKLAARNFKVFLDGGLYLNVKTLMASGYSLKPKTIIKGDEKIPVISLASIVAKVTRDRKMKKLHKKYPEYDFTNNKGYGTKKHIKAIKKYGLSPVHRKSFRILWY